MFYFVPSQIKMAVLVVILCALTLLLSICGFGILYLRTNDTNKRVRDKQQPSIGNDAEILKKLDTLLNRESSRTPKIDGRALEEQVNKLTRKLYDFETNGQNFLTKLDEIRAANGNIAKSNEVLSKDVSAMKQQLDTFVNKQNSTGNNKKLSA